MNIISEFLIYVIEQRNEIFTLLFQHIRLTVFSVIFSIMLGVPLGILIKYVKKLNKPILGFANIVQAIPSMALLGISIPILGIGSAPAIFMVILYSLLPIIKNTYTGLSNISPQILEAAKGIGLTKTQRLFKIQIPLSLPVIMAGIRVSAVTSVGLMTIAAYVGAGGLGYLVFAGIRTINNYQILAGAIPACLLALLVDYVFSIIERLVTPISLQANETIKRKELEDKRKKDKIIIYGNKNIRQVSIIVGDNNKVIEYLDRKKIKYSKLIKVDSILNYNENINGESSEKSFNDLDTLLNKKKLNKKICILDYSNIKVCKNKKYYIVNPNMKINNNNYVNIINNIDNGSIIMIDDNFIVDNFKVLVSKLMSYDLKIVYLSEIIKE